MNEQKRGNTILGEPVVNFDKAFNVRSELEKLHRAGYGWALACCSHDHERASEILQTVYVKILERSARFDGKAQFKTWFFSVIRYTAADVRRKKLLHVLGLSRYQQIGALPGSIRENPGAATERNERGAGVERMLAQLSRRQRDIMHLVFYQDLTIEEAAQIMGISVGSARTHYERGKKKLRVLLKSLRSLE